MINAAIKNWIFGAFAIVVLTACATNPANNLPPINSPALTSYELGAGDVIRVVVFGNSDAPIEYKLDENGEISYPLAGRVSAKGMTTTQFEGVLAKRLEKVLVDAKVNVEVQTARSIFVSGGVNKAGEFPFAKDMTVSNAIAIAGGLTKGADNKVVKISRIGKDGTQKEWRAGPSTFVYPGDTIEVYERF